MSKVVRYGMEESLFEELMYCLSARSFAYDLLKCAFLQEPSKRFLEFLIEGEAVQAFPFRGQEAALDQALDTILTYMKQPDVTSENCFHSLCWDYTRLFVGPGKAPAPPWESLYRNVERLYFTSETLSVRSAYGKYNLLPKSFGREPDDHIGLELDFMHMLCELAKEKASNADGEGLAEILEDQKHFLDDHLLTWAPDWATDVENNAETDFYKGMAKLLSIYLKIDRELIDELFENLDEISAGRL